jgi:hypothetical protein
MVTEGGGAATVAATLFVAVPDTPLLSRTVRITAYVPDAKYVCDAVEPVAVTPSPKFQVYDIMVAPVDALAVLLKVKVSEAVPVAMMLAVGGEPPATDALTLCVATFDPPLASTSVRATV